MPEATTVADTQPDTEQQDSKRRSHRCRTPSSRLVAAVQANGGNSSKAYGRKIKFEFAAMRQGDIIGQSDSSVAVTGKDFAPLPRHALDTGEDTGEDEQHWQLSPA